MCHLEELIDDYYTGNSKADMSINGNDYWSHIRFYSSDLEELTNDSRGMIKHIKIETYIKYARYDEHIQIKPNYDLMIENSILEYPVKIEFRFNGLWCIMNVKYNNCLFKYAKYGKYEVGLIFDNCIWL